MDINNYNFHDKILKFISVGCGENFFDEVRILFMDEHQKFIEIICSDCMSVNMNGNGWIEGNDSVREWVIQCAKDKINNDYMSENVKKDMLYIMFNFNISNSKIEIIARDIQISSKDLII